MKHIMKAFAVLILISAIMIGCAPTGTSTDPTPSPNQTDDPSYAADQTAAPTDQSIVTPTKTPNTTSTPWATAPIITPGLTLRPTSSPSAKPTSTSKPALTPKPTVKPTPKPTPKPTSTPKPTEKPHNPPTISLAEFNSLKTGMTYEKVKSIIGGEGTVLAESDVAGIKTIIYMWEGEGSIGANANCTFQNGKLISKAQFGLK